MGAKVTTMHGGREVWKYGEAGDRYPVQIGEVWQMGPHILACGDNSFGAAKEFVQTYGPAKLVYSDPPWNQGNIAAFRTKAGQPGSTVFPEFLDGFMASIISSPVAFVEMGLKELPDLAAAAERVAWKMTQHWTISYYGSRPCALALLQPMRLIENGVLAISDDPAGMDDTLTPGWVMERVGVPGDTVFDPCMGQGCTAEWGVKHGRLVRGVEMHPRRLACAIEKIVKATGFTPIKVGELACMK